MTKKINISEVAEFLKANDDYLILTHIRPDGDTLGCGGALTQGLRELGKTVYMLENFGVTDKYKPYVDEYRAPKEFAPQHIIAVDTATEDLFPDNAAGYIGKVELCVDHHGTNTGYAINLCCLPDYASCGEIIYEILEKLFNEKNMVPSGKIADLLYIAISTDTGCFAYGNTTANTHRIAALITDLGASIKSLNKLLFRTKRRSRILIEGKVNSGIEFYHNDIVAMVTITKEMMEASGADEDDIDDIANIAISIEGVLIGITIREMTSPTDCKISIRTAGDYNASEICARFGGGGHKAAAGASIKKSVEEIKKDLLEILNDYV